MRPYHLITLIAVCLLNVWISACTSIGTPTNTYIATTQSGPTLIPPTSISTATNIPAPDYSLMPAPMPMTYRFDKPDWAQTVLGLGKIEETVASPDGGLVAVVFGAGLGMMETNSLRVRWFDPFYAGRFPSLRWSPDGHILAAVEGFNARFLEASTGTLLFEQSLPDKDWGMTTWDHLWNDAYWSPDSSRIALLSHSSSSPMILDGKTGVVIRPLGPMDTTIDFNTVDWSVDSTTIVWSIHHYTDAEKTIVALHDSIEPLRQFDLFSWGWSPDLSMFETTSDYGGYSVWDSASGKQILPIQYHLRLSPDWKTAISVQPSGIIAWGLPSGSQLWKTPILSRSAEWPVFSSDGDIVAVSIDSSLHGYETRDGKLRFSLTNLNVSPDLEDNTGISKWIVWSPDNRLLATEISGDTGIKIWETSSENLHQVVRTELQGDFLNINGSRRLLLENSGRMAIWDVDHHQTTAQIASNSLDKFVWSEDGKKIIAKSPGHKLFTWDAQTGDLADIATDPEPEETVRPYQIFQSTQTSPDGSLIAEVGEETNVSTGQYTGRFVMTIRDAKTDEVVSLARMQEYTDAPDSFLIWSPNSRYVAVYADGDYYVYGARDGLLIFHSPHMPDGRFFAFSPDSTRLAVLFAGAIYIARLGEE